MSGMSLGLGCYLRCQQKAYLSPTQKIGLKQLCLTEQKLKHKEYPNVIRGLEGMQTAHKILQEKGASGVLIGGLAESVWNQRRKQEDLYKNKDVDVAVLDDDFGLSKNFKGGIDWWTPKNGRITLNSNDIKVIGLQKKWYENANGVILSFDLNKNYRLKPGLYIPDSEWVIDLKEYEADTHVNKNIVGAEFDEGVFEKFRNKLKKKIKTRLPKFICEEFAGYILSPHYEKNYEKTNAIELEKFDLETIRAIQNLEEQVKEII